MKSREEECAAYLREKEAYRRCLTQLKNKWETYGRMAGKVVLPEATDEERRLLSGLVGRALTGSPLSFLASDFEKGLQKTRFAPVSLQGVLEIYFGQPLQTQKDRRLAKEKQRVVFWSRLLSKVESRYGPDAAAVCWIQRMRQEKTAGYARLMRLYEEDPGEALRVAQAVADALMRLDFGASGSLARAALPLAVFAAQITGNPHFFDRGTPPGDMLTQAMASLQGVEAPQDAYRWREWMQSIGIVPDTVSSLVHVYGIVLHTPQETHPAFRAFCERHESYVVTLEALGGITAARPLAPAVYIVENEMVFCCLIALLRHKNAALICTSGQPRAAALRLMDLLRVGGYPMYYNGDMDPEGLAIADRLQQRYGQALTLWRMKPQDYEKALSREKVPEERLRKTEHLASPALIAVAKKLKEHRRAAYQENMLEDLLSDIERGEVGR